MTITPCQVGWLRTLFLEHEDVMAEFGDEDPSATSEMLREVQAVYDALAAEVKRNGSPTDLVCTMLADEQYDVLLFPHDYYDLDRIQEYAESACVQPVFVDPEETCLRR